jgi:hypothetical protein
MVFEDHVLRLHPAEIPQRLFENVIPSDRPALSVK